MDPATNGTLGYQDRVAFVLDALPSVSAPPRIHNVSRSTARQPSRSTSRVIPRSGHTPASVQRRASSQRMPSAPAHSQSSSAASKSAQPPPSAEKPEKPTKPTKSKNTLWSAEVITTVTLIGVTFVIAIVAFFMRQPKRVRSTSAASTSGSGFMSVYSAPRGDVFMRPSQASDFRDY